MTDLHGKFIVFDGTEGCGKSTQAELLRRQLEADGLRVMLVRDPGTTRIGEQIRAILLNPDHDEMRMRCEMLLYMAARAQMMAQTIRPALDDGMVVLSDRFISSTLAYQLGGDGLTATEIRAVGDIAVGGRWPDLTVLLDMSAEASMERVQPKLLFKDATDLVAKDRIERRPMDYHERVRANYLAQAAADPLTYRVVRADREKQAVHEDVVRAVMNTIPSPGTPGEG
ncbi:MAG TPA: dTMP kinase [Tepidisphaeraceae bacterium]|jgi:dTMP kinase|nr:dTMP kinase [Tepidisphaeraceae bacterium]